MRRLILATAAFAALFGAAAAGAAGTGATAIGATGTVGSPGKIVPSPVKIVKGDGKYSPKGDGSDVKTYLENRRFTREIEALGIPDFSKEEAYKIVIGKEGIVLHALTDKGLYRARTSLDYMMSMGPELECCTITDYPRFRHRGLMLDISRNFRDKDFILKQLDAMARLKMSALHLHLTDDAGWRVRIDACPELTSKVAWRVGKTHKEWAATGRRYSEEGAPDASGGYLTKADVKEIVEYAAARHIDIIPEIELPSHSKEVLTAYPALSCLTADGSERVISGDLCPGKEGTFNLLETIFSEIVEMFPCTYVHIGGDEASKRGWHDCPDCRRRMAEEGLEDVDELQSYMVRRVGRFLGTKGRKIVGWDEILEGGLAEGAVVMSWRGTEGGIKAAAMGHDVIMSPGKYCYFDSYQDAPFSQPEAFSGYTSLARVHSFDPVEGIPDASRVLGLQANLWTEFVPTAEHAEYMLYPRAFAIAETGWSPVREKDYPEFKERSLALLDIMGKEGYNTFDLRAEVGPRPESLADVEHLGKGAKVEYSTMYSASHPAGGEDALVDGKRGGWFYNDGRWQGFLCDVDVVMDLGTVKDIHYVGATFLSHTTSGVGFPIRTEVSFSEDGKDFSEPVTCLLEIRDHDSNALLHTLGSVVSAKARYIRYKAVRDDVRKNPEHAFIFIDEIVVN